VLSKTDCSESDYEINQSEESEDSDSESDGEAKPEPEFEQKARHEAELTNELAKELEAGRRERIRIWLYTYLSLALCDTRVKVAAASLHPPLHLLVRSSDAPATSLAAMVTESYAARASYKCIQRRWWATAGARQHEDGREAAHK
jgi:hypothetical protein